MTVIVTGHRGFIGGNLHTRLIEQQANFIALDTEDGEINYMDFAYKRFDIETIYHIGAIAGIEECEENRSVAFDLNVTSVQRWAQIALVHGARLVFTSSAAAAKVTPTWYGLTKKMAEDMLLQDRKSVV